MLTTFLELYEADRRAHEEAVQNGGVSFSPFPFFHSYRVNAYQRLAYHVLVRRARRGGQQPRYLHLAIPPTRHRCQLPSPPHRRRSARCSLVRVFHSRATCYQKGQRRDGDYRGTIHGWRGRVVMVPFIRFLTSYILHVDHTNNYL